MKTILKPLYIVTTNYHGATPIAMSSSFYNAGYATEKAARSAARRKAEQLEEQYVRELTTSSCAPLSESEARQRVAVEESPVSGVVCVRQFTSASHTAVWCVCYFDIAKITPA